MLRRIALLLAVAVVVAASASAAGSSYSWHDTPTGTTAHLRGVAAVSARVAWASGYVGTVLRTTDRGEIWKQVGPPGTQDLQFRDIEAFDANRAVIMSVGDRPEAFRIYVTANGGRSWTLGFVNHDPNAFYDCMTFFDRRHGLALSDPPDGKHFRVIATNDGGYTWHLWGKKMPEALPGEFAFAAGGQCLTSDRHGHAWFGTGGAAQARVFRSDDRGEVWHVATTPIRSGPTAGIFALAFRGPRLGLAVGGDFNAPTASPDNFARTFNGGRSWQLLPGAPAEYRSGVTWVNGHTAIAVGLTGSDVTFNRGATWQRFDEGSFDTVDCAHRPAWRPAACWAAGENGRVAYLIRTH